MYDSVRPHRWQPTRLPHPWDSPGKNTGVGCHFLFQCMKMKSESEVAQSCPTLSMDCSLPGSSVHGIFQARVLEQGAIAFSRLVHIYTGIFLLPEIKRFYLEKRKVKNCVLVSCCLPNELPQIWCFVCVCVSFFFNFFFKKFYFIFKLHNIVLVLPNIEMNPPQVYMCSPSCF